MKLWIRVIRGHKISRDTVFDTGSMHPVTPEDWAVLLSEALKPMDVSVPVVLSGHARDLETFRRTSFKASDFMERIDFDRLEAEILPEKKRKTDSTSY